MIVGRFEIFVTGGLLGFAVGWMSLQSPYDGRVHVKPVDSVQSGYLHPSAIRIYTKDLDGNGKLETIMQVAGKEYLLRHVNEKPIISEYSIKPAEIVLPKDGKKAD